MTTEKIRFLYRKMSTTELQPWPYGQNICISCAACSGACPVAGVDNFDPRKVVRMAALGMGTELIESRWPWICTMCGKCEQICPMEVAIPDLIRKIRSLKPREKVPGILHKGLMAAIQTGNNLGLPEEDFTFILQDVGEEIKEEDGYKTFEVPINKEKAHLLTTIHNKLVNTHTDDLKHWWKIFHAAGEDWTVVSQNWEGTSWGYFTGDDGAMRTMSGRIIDNMKRYNIGTLLWPE